ncbi:putative sulfite reductase [Lyophyllum shimeji]|uniref:assimilatory sulfite reductase (NADPH) n=1 Tax=Lyophyllum shimeji TaxID=47721 RepID=A0A9P3UHC7_LYOSH|nr:putative sulfite reductase [Lyophyllum shimeji]
MTFSKSSGASTPFSSTTTLSSPPSPSLKGSAGTLDQDVYFNSRLSASTLVEFTASRQNNSSTVYIYDLAEQAGFGTLTKEWAKSGSNTAPVVDLQTRAGAGLSLVGRLSEGTSQDTVKGAVLTTYTTPSGLSMMAPSLSHLPAASPTSRLVMQVPTVTAVGETFSLSPSLAPLASTWSILPENIVVLLSATPQQTVDFAALSYKLTHSHVIHIFDQHSSARETGHLLAPLPGKDESENTSAAEVITNAGHKFFECFGDAQAHTAIVLLNGPLALTAAAVAGRTSGLAVLVVNVLRPWNEIALRSTLPQSVVNVHIIDDVPNASTQGALHVAVFGTLLENGTGTSVHTHRVTPSRTQEYLNKEGAFLKFLAGIAPTVPDTISFLQSPTLKRVLLLSSPESPLAALPRLTEALFTSSNGLSVRSLTDYDVFSKPGGIAASRLLLSSKSEVTDFLPLATSLPLDPSSEGTVDFLAVLDQSLLKSHTVLRYAKPRSPVLVVTAWSPDELSPNLPSETTSLIADKGLRIFIINTKEIASAIEGAAGPASEVIQVIIAHLAFVRLYLGSAATESNVLGVVRAELGDVVEGSSLETVSARAWAGLEEIEFTQPSEPGSPLKAFDFNAIAVETESGETVVNGARLASWHDAAKHLIFPAAFTPPTEPSSEEYPPNPALRPEVADRTYLVTCSVNRRLTPLEYDRNVFHLEFDTTGTGLKYAIGEALGVHGWNDEREVLHFCEWYAVDPNRLITIPVVAGEGKMHTRTVFQALRQQIDLFGHPPKSFYTDLAAYATSSVDRHALLFVGSPEGSSTYKKLSEKDTVTFVDILKKYPSAKPGIEKLCELVGDIKPRHYSIASAQSVVGNRVDLLVVTVEWVTPSGTPRYGQCTRYLAGLKVGQKVTVSIKPSVMKLPPNPKQPIIMAGLGTGAAPFRAFLQHFALLASQGQEIGPVYYYFGSRHQASEYLYGEEIESFILDGIITRAGLAFSRDGPKKVYIQHKMLEDSEALAQMLHDDDGVFYLCGPTWPVPDVYEALVNALVKYKGADPVKAGQYLESLKEEERYVLEVY